jgi:spermidine synthase
MKQINHAILWVVIATGISSVVLQLISIRELLARFQGNEFVIALILFSWMALGGIGAFFAKWTAQRFFVPALNRLIWLSLVLTALPIIQVIAIREAYDIVFIHGSSVGFYPTFLYILLILAPYSLLLGFALPYSLFVLRRLAPEYPGARIYIIDNIGDVAGGALFSFALVSLVTPFAAVCLANIPLIAACLLLVARSGLPKFRFFLAGLLAGCLLLSGFLLEKNTLIQPEGELIHYRESRYGRIEILQQHEMRTLLLDGVPLFSNQNQHMAEEIVHYPLIQIPNPQHVLILSGEGGIMKEIEKYHPETVDYVELDPDVTKAELQFGLILAIDGLHIIHQDGRAYLAGTNKSYDAIIHNLPEPNTFQLNRFFTDEFYQLVKQRLTTGGVFSFAMQGFDNYLPEPQQKKLSIIYNTLRRHFKHVLLLPGQQIFFLCSDSPLSTKIPERLEIKKIPTQYISAYYDGDLSQKRIEDLNRLIEPHSPLNQDYRPQIMRVMFSQWFKKYAASPSVFIAVILILMLLYLVFIPRESYVLFTTGFVNMGSEILVIFAFQIFFGYIYFQIGIIVTVFLAGLLPGAWFGQRLRNKNRHGLAISDCLLILLIGCFIASVFMGGQRLPVSFFMIFGFSVSLVSGFQFPIALQLQGGGKSAAARSFSADLTGAACGTLITSLLLMPYGGILWAAIALMGVKASSLILNLRKLRHASYQ